MSKINVDRFLASTGQFTRARFVTVKTPSAAHKGKRLVKEIEGVFRTGNQYRNLGAITEAIAAGERGPVQPLPWGKWENYPYVIVHNGNYYIRLYPPHQRDDEGRLVPHWKKGQLIVKYLVDNHDVERDEFYSFLPPSADRDGKIPDCFTVKAEHFEVLCD